MDEFYTRKIANDGVKMPLDYPDGTPSEQWIMVRGIDSDEFRMAESQGQRALLDLSQVADEKVRAAKLRETELECLASLIAGWSFDSELSHENIIHFLKEAPQIADTINAFAANRAVFFVKKSTSFTHGQSRKLTSKKSPPVQK